MSADKPIIFSAQDNLIKAVADFIRDDLGYGRSFEEMTYPDRFAVSSPIEHLLWKAIEILFLLHDGGTTIGVCDDGKVTVVIEPQKTVLDWRVDFAISVRGANSGALGSSMLIIECDGHDFHERTKEQAKKDRARDRRLQEAGHTVYRFTGSEIYRDSFSCARQIHRWVESAIWRDA